MNGMFDLNTLWFLLVGVLFTGYVILDGFDLGVGALYLFARKDEDRRIFLNAIGPVWDGNEVWLVTGGGALFAAFPEVYASVFSGFYLAFMLLLCGLFFRAVAIEFRSKRPNPGWRSAWDYGFHISSVVSGLLIGVAMGNIAWGIALGAGHEYLGTFWGLLKPYPLLMGLTTVSLFMMHGAIYLALKTEGSLHEKIRGWVKKTIMVFILFYAVTTIATLLAVPHMLEGFKAHPFMVGLPLLVLLAIANIPREIHHGRDFTAFLSSCAAMAGLMALFGLGMYPNLVFSSPVVEHSLTIYNAASSGKTLGIMAVIAVLGMPLVLAYTTGIYWIFRGKVKLDPMSY